MEYARTTPEELLPRARAGDVGALGMLLDRYRNYLRFLARTLMVSPLRLQVDPSDVIQETSLEAARDFARFTGATESELLSWLRRILVRNLADQLKHHQAGRRDLRRSESLEDLLERSGAAVHRALACSAPSPPAQAESRERAVALADALEGLPEDYREVLRLRNLEHLPFDEVAARMGRSPGAVRMLWTRALEALSRGLEAGS